MHKKSLALTFFATVFFSEAALPQNFDPRTKDEYAQVITQCYTENLGESWEKLRFKYTKKGVNSLGKTEFLVTAQYLADDKKWKEAPWCHDLAPLYITEAYLKNIGKHNDAFKEIELIAEPSGKSEIKVSNDKL